MTDNIWLRAGFNAFLPIMLALAWLKNSAVKVDLLPQAAPEDRR